MSTKKIVLIIVVLACMFFVCAKTRAEVEVGSILYEGKLGIAEESGSVVYDIQFCLFADSVLEDAVAVLQKEKVLVGAGEFEAVLDFRKVDFANETYYLQIKTRASEEEDGEWQVLGPVETIEAGSVADGVLESSVLMAAAAAGEEDEPGRVASAADGGCPVIDFENYAPDTVITNQYTGVVFSAPDDIGSCSGDAIIREIPTSWGGTSSGTQAVGSRAGTGCEFSPEHLRMVFDNGQEEVRFTVGPYPGTYNIKAYDSAVGGSLVSSQNFTFPDPFSMYGVHRLITVTPTSGNIRRIDIDAGDGASEHIDDLVFDVDQTPPIAEIESPGYEGCACDSVSVYGEACDDDGDYGIDMLEYLRVDAAVGTPWTLIGSYTSPLCGGGLLYTWDTTGLEHGHYYLRLTVENACGLVSTDVTVVLVDKVFSTLDLRYPANESVIGGHVCFDGTVWDHLCFDNYSVNYTPAGAGTWNPVDPMYPVYTSYVINDPFARWETSTVPDGLYEVFIEAMDSCGNAESIHNLYTVDNTPPTAYISYPTDCENIIGPIKIEGTVDDANLRDWVLQITGGDLHGWVTLASGDYTVINNVLGEWDNHTWRPCAYTIRLIAWDRALLDCMSPYRNRTEYTVSVNLMSGCLGDLDGDGDVDLDDFAMFATGWLNECP